MVTIKNKKKIVIKKKIVPVKKIIEPAVITLDNIELCSRCGFQMKLDRIAGNTKEFSCSLCGKKLSKN